MHTKQFFATCKFGLEKFLADELRFLGAEDVRSENARVFFAGGWDTLIAANLWLRCADRVFWLIGQFPAASFDELFEGVKALNWTDILDKNDAFPVKGKTAASKLHSVSDCQAICKKAIAEKLKSRYKLSWLEEKGPVYQIEVGMLNDVATIGIDASGAGLGRRGYRKLNAAAPLAETLAAALVKCCRWHGNRPFWDPCCGSGTIAIEAAMIAQNMAPGLKRKFAAEQWTQIDPKLWADARKSALQAIKGSCEYEIMASDIDEQALKLTRIHAKNADVKLKIFRADMRNLSAASENGQIVCNPPYGERLFDKDQTQKLYRDMGNSFRSLPDWSYAILSADPQFERFFAKRASKRRKLYNSNILCQFYQYF